MKSLLIIIHRYGKYSGQLRAAYPYSDMVHCSSAA